MVSERNLIVAITGATGAVFGIRVLELLRSTEIATHLVMSRWGARTLAHETSYTLEQVESLATHIYAVGDQGAPISSGSFLSMGMVIAPCTMSTLGSIAHGVGGDNLIHRAADVILKERRKLVLVARESPLSEIHLENMLKLSRMGAVIFPPVPAFYNHPQDMDDMVTHVATRVLDQFGIHLDSTLRWDGVMKPEAASRRARS
ncbi:MAG: UbiX family flavin prenyltransferase [Candidatus Korobacteraceae bacterium]